MPLYLSIFLSKAPKKFRYKLLFIALGFFSALACTVLFLGCLDSASLADDSSLKPRYAQVQQSKLGDHPLAQLAALYALEEPVKPSDNKNLAWPMGFALKDQAIASTDLESELKRYPQTVAALKHLRKTKSYLQWQPLYVPLASQQFSAVASVASSEAVAYEKTNFAVSLLLIQAEKAFLGKKSTEALMYLHQAGELSDWVQRYSNHPSFWGMASLNKLAAFAILKRHWEAVLANNPNWRSLESTLELLVNRPNLDAFLRENYQRLKASFMDEASFRKTYGLTEQEAPFLAYSLHPKRVINRLATYHEQLLLYYSQLHKDPELRSALLNDCPVAPVTLANKKRMGLNTPFPDLGEQARSTVLPNALGHLLFKAVCPRLQEEETTEEYNIQLHAYQLASRIKAYEAAHKTTLPVFLDRVVTADLKHRLPLKRIDYSVQQRELLVLSPSGALVQHIPL